MAFSLEIRSTQNWEDVRYRAYTSSERKAEAFRKLPKIKFTDSGHGLVPSVNEHRGRKLPLINTLSDYVREHTAAERKGGMTKAELRGLYLQWAREEMDSIILLEAVGAYLGNPERAA